MSKGTQVAQLLFDEVADHALRLRAEDVERVGWHHVVGGALERQEADLGPVAVGDDELVLDGDGSQRLTGDAHVLALVVARHGFAAAQQRVAAKGDDDPHVSAGLTALAAELTAASGRRLGRSRVNMRLARAMSMAASRPVLRA